MTTYVSVPSTEDQQLHIITPCPNSINIGQQTFLRYLLTQPRKLRVLTMFNVNYMSIIHILWFFYFRGRSGRDRMVVGFITTYAINDPYQFYL